MDMVSCLVVTQPIAGGFARVSPKPWCAKGLTFGQYTHNLLSSKTYQSSFPLDLYSTQYLMIFSKFWHSRNRSASPVPVDRKTGFNVGLTRQPRSGGTALQGMRVTSPTRVGSERTTNGGWQRHDKTCFLTPTARS
jgi:hypothetical protein